MNLHLVSVDPDIKNKKELEKSIAQKKTILQKLAKKVDLLQKDLQQIQEAYERRIGRLYAKDNDLDIEIIKYKNIVRLMKEGHTLLSAKDQLDSFLFSKHAHVQSEEATQHVGFDTFSSELGNDTIKLRALWKKLILQFHPDLVTDKDEKTKREKIMQKINKAYSNQDIKALLLLESNLFLEEPKDNSISQLEYTLVEIENLIIGLEKQYKSLKLSEWFSWKRRLKQVKVDIFADLEKTLLDDIVSKTKILNDLKKEAGDIA